MIAPGLGDRARDQVRDAEQPRHLRRGGAGEHLGARSRLQQPALVDDEDLVGEQGRLLGVVGDEDGGQARLALQAAQLAAQFLADRGVERAERLVEQHQPRLEGERPGERDALPLAAGQLAGQPARQAVEAQRAQPPGGQRRVGAGPRTAPAARRCGRGTGPGPAARSRGGAPRPGRRRHAVAVEVDCAGAAGRGSPRWRAA